MSPRLSRITSGGQTGTDTAALRAAVAAGVPTGGWMPKGWLTLAGPRPQYERLYGMREAPTASWSERTSLNARDSHRTLIVASDLRSRGTRATVSACKAFGRPFLPVEFGAEPARLAEPVAAWVLAAARAVASEAGEGLILNVAGNRDLSLEAPVEAWLTQVFREVMRRQAGEALT